MAQERKAVRGAVVVTGASTGIGKACALYLDETGFRVFAGVRKDTDGERLKQESRGRIIPVFLDVTDSAAVGAAAGTVAEAVGEAGLSGLVNNAGIVVAGPLEFVPLEEVRNQFEVNVLGQIAVTRALLPLLRKGRGRIVNMGSISGRLALPFLGPYAASKFAFEAITDALRVELLPSGITISIIEPGDVATPIWKKSMAATEKMVQQFPPQALDFYGAAFTAARSAAERAARAGIPPLVVARAVARALTARSPRTRYLVGHGARMQAFLKKFLPDRMIDRVVLWYIGLPGKTDS